MPRYSFDPSWGTQTKPYLTSVIARPPDSSQQQLQAVGFILVDSSIPGNTDPGTSPRLGRVRTSSPALTETASVSPGEGVCLVTIRKT